MAPIRHADRLRLVRSGVGSVVTGSIAGMIACAVTHHLGGVIALGCISAGAIVVLIATTYVYPDAEEPSAASDSNEDQERRVETLVERVVQVGVPESDVRTLVGESVRLGRRQSPAQER